MEIAIRTSCMPRGRSGKNLWPENERFEGFRKWLVETQNKILSRIAILSYTSSVQVGRQNGLRLFGGNFHKNGHNFLS